LIFPASGIGGGSSLEAFQPERFSHGAWRDLVREKTPLLRIFHEAFRRRQSSS
jgi:hypothetical protein